MDIEAVALPFVTGSLASLCKRRHLRGIVYITFIPYGGDGEECGLLDPSERTKVARGDGHAAEVPDCASYTCDGRWKCRERSRVVQLRSRRSRKS